MNYKNIDDYEILYLVEENNEDAYYYMYDKYAPLINKMATRFYRKYAYVGIEYDDLYQEGMFALSEALKEYKKTESAMFFTLAFVCMKREMQRLVIKATRYKNLFNNNAVSLNQSVYDTDMTIENTIYNISDVAEYKFIDDTKEKEILNIKYELNDVSALVYELKLNGFSNVEISNLLDLTYKKVDNSLRTVKNYLNKNNIV